MAKQMGIHQIRGKVGERSYYRTKGVDTGVSRSINQSLSARVKTGDEYANTRLNNAEFKNANSIATAAFNSVNTRKRGMLRSFAIAEMTKFALEDIKQGTGAWGVRLPQTNLDSLICDLLEKHAKGGAYDGQFGVFGDPSLVMNGTFNLDGELDVTSVNALKAMGVDGLVFVPSKALAGEIVVDGVPRLYAGSAIGTPSVNSLTANQPLQITISGSVATPSSVGMSANGYVFAQEDKNHGFYLVISILPYRIEGGSQHTLQELCTFFAVPLGQLPTE